jgi:hypothetical protein
MNALLAESDSGYWLKPKLCSQYCHIEGLNILSTLRVDLATVNRIKELPQIPGNIKRSS